MDLPTAFHEGMFAVINRLTSCSTKTILMAELNVTRKTIGKLFSEMQGRKFIIPEYQRPYKWNEEMCETLWQDITEFYNSGEWRDNEYFLGTIVSFADENVRNELHIIDGQQRITTFFLLLRSIYYKLERMANDDPRVIGLKNQIAPCLWDVDPISQLVTDTTNIHIYSRVATETDNEAFHQILENGEPELLNNRYAMNYRFFRKKCDEFAEANPMNWQELCVSILQRCILLPIECSTSDTALKIFSTLNNRGLPLSDSDIFKAAIYQSKPTQEEKSEFNEKWKEITEICKQAHCTIDDLFRYYSHYLRGKANDTSREIGLRKFYESGIIRNEKLHRPDLMVNIDRLAKFWLYANTGKFWADFELTFDNQVWKSLQILNAYPNEFWKYVVSVFYLNHCSDGYFETHFSSFLQRLSAFLLVKFIEKPTVNAIRDDIFQMCADISHRRPVGFSCAIGEHELSQRIPIYSTSRITRALLLTHAYLHPEQTDPILGNCDIEHIFPKKWQTANYNGWNVSEAREHLERFGNKILLETRLNIQAGNGYFQQKKSKYSQSGIHSARSLSTYASPDWVKEDIEQRERLFTNDLIAFFRQHLN